MNNKKCLKCKTLNPKEAKVCSKCSAPFNEEDLNVNGNNNDNKNVPNKVLFALIAIVFILFIVVIVLIFNGKDKENPNDSRAISEQSSVKDSSVTTTTTTAPATTTTTTATKETTTTTTKATTTTTSSKEEPQGVINPDIFTDYGKTYKQLAEKYGKHTDSGYYGGGGIQFTFDGNMYFFGTQTLDIPTDKDLCNTIITKADVFFSNLEGKKTYKEVAQEYSIGDWTTAFLISDNINTMRFEYEGYSIVIESESEDFVVPKSNVIIIKVNRGE